MLTPSIMDRRTPEEIREMAATTRMYLRGVLVTNRPLPARYFAALDLVNAGRV